MRSRFFEGLRLHRGQRGVQARGPLEWEDGDIEATIAVIIYQDDGKIAGPGCSPRTFTPEDTEWELDVIDPRGSRFKGGTAHGKVMAVVARREGPAQELEWREQLTLVPPDRNS